MKNTYRIGGALAIGIVVILGAFYMKNGLRADEANGIVVVANPPERDYIESQDSNGDGIPNWQEGLEAKAFTTITTPSSTISLGEDTKYTPPTTLTGKFSEAFFQDYLDGKIKGQDFSDPTAFVNTAVAAIEENVQSKKHSSSELVVVPNSFDAIRNYGNEVGNILKIHSRNNENEAVILQKALSANDPTILDALVPIRTAYESALSDLLQMNVPLALAQAHINLVNAFEAILTDIMAMQVAFTDPLYALARAKGYLDDSQQLFNAFQGITGILIQNDIIYRNDETGFFFFIFNT